MHQTEDINSVVTSPRRGLPGPLPVRTNLLRLESFAWIVRLAIYRIPVYDKLMIESFRDAETEKIFQQQPSKQFRAIEKTVLRKLMHLNQARSLRDLTAIPGNRLEALKGTRKGQYSIRINDQYRICFIWMDGDACAVEITDYH
jgi:proteic killer suppression protein